MVGGSGMQVIQARRQVQLVGGHAARVRASVRVFACSFSPLSAHASPFIHEFIHSLAGSIVGHSQSLLGCLPPGTTGRGLKSGVVSCASMIAIRDLASLRCSERDIAEQSGRRKEGGREGRERWSEWTDEMSSAGRLRYSIFLFFFFDTAVMH